VKPGVRVSHPAFGVGIVSAVNLTGAARRAHVDFGYTQAWIVLDVLEVLQEESAAAPVSTQTELEAQAPSRPAEEDVEQTFDAADVDIAWSTTPTLPKSQTEARKGIAALRLGQILQSQALQLSVGTETLQRRLREALSRALAGKPTFILIDGAWGGGKTHALTLLQSLAREQKMTTSGAVMDGVAVTLSEPTRLMEAIVGSIRVSGDGSDDGIGHLLRMAKLQGRSPSLRARGAREVADALDSFPPRAFDDPEALQCIEDYFSFALSATQVRA